MSTHFRRRIALAYRPASSSTPLVLTRATMPPASELGPEHYWPARSGRAGTTYSGAVLLLGATDYIYWTHGGRGHDPAPAGRTGHVVALASGNLTGAQVAAATAPVLAAVTGWEASSAVGAELRCRHATDAVTTGAAWSSGSMVGMRSISGTHEGGVASALAQYLPSPALDAPLLAVDVLVGAVADAGDLWRAAIYTDTAGAPGTRTIDLGQLPAVTADTWCRYYVPASSNVRGTAALWFTLKSSLNTTTIRGVLTGNALRGDWPAANLMRSDGTVSADASVAWPATWTGALEIQAAFVLGVRLIFGSAVGDASHHSAADPAIFGTHTAAGDLGSVIDLDSRLFMVAPAPPFLGMVIGGEGWAVGDARGTQPRLGVYTGGDAVEAVDPDGATLLVDGGQLVGSSTDAWEYRTHAPVAWTANVATAWAVKCDDDTTGTRIRFAQDPNQIQANAPDAPMDWLEAVSGGVFGSEYEEFGADNDPTTTFVSPYVSPVSPARPRNIPGARILWWIPGIVIS